jgi:hypothetical protein
MKYCGKCGETSQPDMAFCQGCGTKFTQGQSKSQTHNQIQNQTQNQTQNQIQSQTPFQAQTQNKAPLQNTDEGQGGLALAIGIGGGVAGLLIAWHLSAIVGLIIAGWAAFTSFKSSSTIAKVASSACLVVIIIWLIQYWDYL